MLLLDAPLTFREYMMNEDVPLAAIFREVLSFLTTREDAVLFGAQAVNAYCEPPRMTADVDVLSTEAAALAEALRAHLGDRFHIATRVREVVPGIRFRVYQVRRPKNRHLVDVRKADPLPQSRRIEVIEVAAPLDLVAMKVLSIAARGGREKSLPQSLGHRAFLDLQIRKCPEQPNDVEAIREPRCSRKRAFDLERARAPALRCGRRRRDDDGY